MWQSLVSQSEPSESCVAVCLLRERGDSFGSFFWRRRQKLVGLPLRLKSFDRLNVPIFSTATFRLEILTELFPNGVVLPRSYHISTKIQHKNIERITETTAGGEQNRKSYMISFDLSQNHITFFRFFVLTEKCYMILREIEENHITFLKII